MTFAKMLHEARVAQGLTQDELSKSSGVSQSTIARFELGQGEPRLSHLEALERALPRLRELRAGANAA